MGRRTLRGVAYTALAMAVFFGLFAPAYAMDVTLRWDANTEPDLAGYKIYYDTDSGPPYDGSGAHQGDSPIHMDLAEDEYPDDPDLVQYTVLNLPDGTYYLAVTAYDDEFPPLESGYSNEVSKPPPSEDFPPYTTNHNPAPGATGVPVNTIISLEVRDAGVGVDQSTIFMRVDGSPVSPSISGTSAVYTVSYDPAVDFGYDQSISVEVDASDLNGNAMNTDAYSFDTAAVQRQPGSFSDSSEGVEEGATEGEAGGGCFISALLQ